MTTTLQRAIGARPVGVAVVACQGPDGPQGLLIGTLASLSSDPPRVSFAVAKTAGPLAALREASSLSIQLLGTDQADVAACFSDSARAAERFSADTWRLTPDQPPRLDGVAACLIGAPWAVFDAQTHALIVVTITAAERFRDATLLYQDGKFIGLR